MEDEQLKIISECSNELVSLSLRNEKEEKQRRELEKNATQKDQEARQTLVTKATRKQFEADKRVMLTFITLFVKKYKFWDLFYSLNLLRFIFFIILAVKTTISFITLRTLFVERNKFRFCDLFDSLNLLRSVDTN